MSSTQSLLKTIRQIHLYLGVFITPALIFFAFTGFLQTFSLHETTRGSSYTPPKIFVQLGQLHKKQTLALPEHRQPPGPPPATDKPREAPPASTARPKNLLLMKLFFALVSIGLLTSTLTGLYMAWKFQRNAKLLATLLIAGIVIPVLLTFV